MGPLGCADSYGVMITNRFGTQQRGELLDVSSLEWGRVIDETSEAKIVIPTQGPDCCKTLAATNDWCDSVALWRNRSELVWEGPITYLEYGRDSTSITASDVTAWLWKRKVRELINYTDSGLGAADLATIGEALVRHALEIDDPGLLQYLTVTAAGVTGKRQYKADSGYVGDHLAELARTGLDFTALGRRIILAGEVPTATLPRLTDDHFLGELKVIKDGRAALTHATVTGKGVTGTAEIEGACGRLDYLANEEEILDVESATAEADSLVAGGYPTPLILSVPDGSALDPAAPVGINDLVPGARVPVLSAQTCREVAADFRLQRVNVSFGDQGESVRVSLVPIGTAV